MDLSTRRIFALALPSVLSMMSFNIMQFADRAFLSRYNPQHFAAVMPSGMISFTILSFFVGVTGFVGALASQYVGADRKGAAARSTWQGLLFSLLSGALILATAWPVSQVFAALGHEKSLADLEGLFYRWMCLSGFFNLCATALGGYFSGLGDTRTPMVMSLVAHGVNLGLDVLLIFGAGPIPPLGLTGAAIATTVANLVQAVLLFMVFLSAKHRLEHGTWETRGFDREIFGRLMKFGSPAGFQFFLDMAGWGLMTLFLGRAGEQVLMAVNISITFESLAFMPAVGLATAASILAGQARGAGLTEGVFTVVRRTVTLTLFYELLVMVLFLFFPELLVSFFLSGSDPAVYGSVRDLAVPILRITGIWIGLDSIRILLASVLKTMGDTVFLMWAYGIGALIIASATAFWVYTSPAPLMPVWFSILTWAVLMFAVMALRFRGGRWKRIDLIGPNTD